MLNILSGLDKVTKGKVIYNDKEITKYSQMKLSKYRKNNIGFIFQTYNLLEHLNVRENVLVGSKLGKTKTDVDVIIDLVGLTKHNKKYMHELSRRRTTKSFYC